MGRRQGLRSRLDAGEESALYPRLEPVRNPQRQTTRPSPPRSQEEEPEEEPKDEDDDADELERDTKTSQAAETQIPSSSTFVRSATGRS